MAKKASTKNNLETKEITKEISSPNITDVEWTEYVLGLLSDDEKIKGNPTTDGLRRVFEIALDCIIVDSTSEVSQAPDPDNGNRATVVHGLSYILNDSTLTPETKCRTVNGAADVYWGNCDKIFRNHPVAVAETRAEGRALRRGLRLRKVVAAEEIAENIEDDIDGNNAGKITNNQINFIDVISARLNVNVLELLKSNKLNKDNIYDIDHSSAVSIIRLLSGYQQNMSDISEKITGYSKDWK